MNLVSLLLNFKSAPVRTVIELLTSLAGDKLGPEIERELGRRITIASRPAVADKLFAISTAIRSGDNKSAAAAIVALLQGIKL